jgi:hypothetical protein
VTPCAGSQGSAQKIWTVVVELDLNWVYPKPRRGVLNTTGFSQTGFLCGKRFNCVKQSIGRDPWGVSKVLLRVDRLHSGPATGIHGYRILILSGLGE